MDTIIGLSGSLRKGSFNSQLIKLAQKHCDNFLIDIPSLDQIPLFNEDTENTLGIPKEVTLLKDKITSACGLIIATPEYNNSFSGVLKNVLDWLSRPAKEYKKAFDKKPTWLIGTSASPSGSRFAQVSLLPVLRYFNIDNWSQRTIYLANSFNAFDQQGNLVDEKTSKYFLESCKLFCEYINKNKK